MSNKYQSMPKMSAMQDFEQLQLQAQNSSDNTDIEYLTFNTNSFMMDAITIFKNYIDKKI